MSRYEWTPAKRQLLADMYPHCHTADVAAWLECTVRQCYAAAARWGITKSQEFLSSADSGRVAPGRFTERMVAGRFQRGMTPWNKGTHYQAGGRSVLTRFKPGQQPSRTKPIGSYRLDAQGLLQRKVADTPGPNHRRWRGVHELLWIEAYGPVPAGHVVCFRPGQRTNKLEEITLDRVECITRGDMGRRNHPVNKSPEYARLVQLKGAITRQVNRIAQEAAQKEST